MLSGWIYWQARPTGWLDYFGLTAPAGWLAELLPGLVDLQAVWLTETTGCLLAGLMARPTCCLDLLAGLLAILIPGWTYWLAKLLAGWLTGYLSLHAGWLPG